MWSHGRSARKHLHIAVQPVTAEVRARYGGLRSEQLQTRMLADGDELPDGSSSPLEGNHHLPADYALGPTTIIGADVATPPDRFEQAETLGA